MTEDKRLILAIDFDGTICKHAEYPEIGEPVPHVLWWMRLFHDAGARSFLWTCRDGLALSPALRYLHEESILLDGINQYAYWDGFKTSVKLFANIYIDDAAVGAPLIRERGHRPCLNWKIAGPIVLCRIRAGELRPI